MSHCDVTTTSEQRQGPDVTPPDWVHKLVMEISDFKATGDDIPISIAIADGRPRLTDATVHATNPYHDHIINIHNGKRQQKWPISTFAKMPFSSYNDPYITQA